MSRRDTTGVESACVQRENKLDGLLSDDNADQELSFRSAGCEYDAPSVVLADQVKSLDWRVRQATRKGVASVDELADVRAKIFALIG
jgi:mRNA-degrading endonuclease toxin of MazEF toxin-antitoxin module